MARVAKIDNAFKKRFQRDEKKRSIDNRNFRLYYLIVCEGEKTEPNYFEAIKKELPVGIIDLKIEGTGRNTIGLINHTIAMRDKSNRKYDYVWAVFDKNSFPPENFNGAIIKANANNIKCAWSNEAFELWFLLHFQFVNHAMNRDDYKAFLEREIQRTSGDEQYRYKKNAIETYSLLKTFGNQTQAIEWAKRLTANFTDERYAMHNPCTQVYELIEKLLNPFV
ncbi:MAG: RloB family protein [Bacteroidota bacterium]